MRCLAVGLSSGDLGPGLGGRALREGSTDQNRMDEAPDSFLSAVHLGIRGYVVKDASSPEIIAAVRAVVIVDHICGKLIPNA